MILVNFKDLYNSDYFFQFKMKDSKIGGNIWLNGFFVVVESYKRDIRLSNILGIL